MVDMTSQRCRQVAGFLSAVARSDRATALRMLSLDFGVHEGRSSVEWVDHEIREYARRRRSFGLEFDPIVEAVACTGHELRFVVRRADGGFGYQDAICFDSDDALRGNNRLFEVVTKLSFSPQRPVCRALAVRSPRARIQSVVPIDLVADSVELRRPPTEDEDGFAVVQIALRDDDLLERVARFRIRDEAGVGQSFDVLMRGASGPDFVADLHPQIAGQNVAIPESPLPWWSLTVALADGRTETVVHPQPGNHEFQALVVWASATDALDNDWMATA